LNFDREAAMSDEERIRTDREVVLIRAAIDEGIAELDAGLGEEMTVEDFVAEIRGELGISQRADVDG